MKPFLGDINAYLEFQKLSSLKELEKKTPVVRQEKKESDPASFEKQKSNALLNKKLKKQKRRSLD